MSLKDDKQQNIQIELDFSSALTGEAREAGREETDGGSGKHRAAAELRCWNWGCESRWRATPLAAGAALGTSRRPRPCPWGFLMRTSNRSVFRHCSRNVSVTDSNRRVRTRMHGGVAGVGG